MAVRLEACIAHCGADQSGLSFGAHLGGIFDNKIGQSGCLSSPLPFHLALPLAGDIMKKPSLSQRHQNQATNFINPFIIMTAATILKYLA
jgi:hypothetical protein